LSDWIIDHTGTASGTVRREAPPRFSARWTSGDDPGELAAIQGPVWSDEGSGEDAIHLYGFAWRDAAPPQAEFQRLMAEAVREIDGWIARRL
jgi:hypothetical protein